jgi:aryl-alcohol dehydrogenase-like predicted oxidoreductase
MELRLIPNTTLKVSPLCLGTMTFGTPVAAPEAIQITHQALEKGLNFIDTANMYEGYTRYVGSPGGVSEEILGQALAGRREKVILATKVGMKIGPADDDQGLSRRHILREVERSLTRLKTGYIDLYYMHKPDAETPLAESVQTFDELLSAGKIRAWGVSNFSAEQLSGLLALCDQNGWRRPVAIQPAYSYLKRDIEADLLPLCQREQIAVFPYQVLQGGLLTGKYRRSEPIPANSRQLEKPAWTLPLTDELFDKLEQCQREGQQLGRSLMQHALMTLLEQPLVLSLIVGIKNAEQLDDLIAAVS